MNTSVRLAYIATASPVMPFNELDCVRLLRDIEDMNGKAVPSGSVGTVVSVWGEGDAYEVEFLDPIQALATVKAEDLESETSRG